MKLQNQNNSNRLIVLEDLLNKFCLVKVHLAVGVCILCIHVMVKYIEDIFKFLGFDEEVIENFRREKVSNSCIVCGK